MLWVSFRNANLETRAPAHALAVSILNTIEFNLSERADVDLPGRRRIARGWGAVYLNDDGTVEEEPAPDPKLAGSGHSLPILPHEMLTGWAP